VKWKFEIGEWRFESQITPSLDGRGTQGEGGIGVTNVQCPTPNVYASVIAGSIAKCGALAK